MTLAALARALRESRSQAGRVVLILTTMGASEVGRAVGGEFAAADRRGVGVIINHLAVIEDAPIVLEYVRSELKTLSPVVEGVAGTSTTLAAESAISDAAKVGFLRDMVDDLGERLKLAAKRIAMNHPRQHRELSRALEQASRTARGVTVVRRLLDEAARRHSEASDEIGAVSAGAFGARPTATQRVPKAKARVSPDRLGPAVSHRRISASASAELRDLTARANSSIERIQGALQGSDGAPIREVLESPDLEDIGSGLDDLQDRVKQATARLDGLDPERTEQPIQAALAKARGVLTGVAALRERINAGYGARDSLSLEVALDAEQVDVADADGGISR